MTSESDKLGKPTESVVDETSSDATATLKDEVKEVANKSTESKDDSKDTTKETSNDDSKDDIKNSDLTDSPAPPAKPPRPLSPHSQAQATLEEAFPGVDKSVIRAVLIASQYKLDPAFNALLAMSDPDFKPEEAFPIDDSEEVHPSGPDPKQLAEDEALARKLAAEYNRSSGRSAGNPPPPPSRTSTSGDHFSSNRTRQSTSSGYSGRYDEPRPLESERSFFDDDLPEIRANLEKGFNETKTKVSSWMNNFRKKIDGEGGQPGIFGALGGTGNSPRSSYDNDTGNYQRNRRTSGDDYPEDSHRQPQRPARYNSGNRRVYDRDPDEINDDFQGVSLRDETEAPPKPPRPSGETARRTSNTSSTTPSSEPPKQPNRPRAVSALGDDDPEEITKSFAPPPLSATKLTSATTATTTGATAKWEPLKSVAPEPESDKDPFFIGDSDEDDDEEEPATTTK